MDQTETFDFVIVGGGTAGCILAARLTENGKFSVLLLEAGGSKESMWVRIPAGFTKTWRDPRHNWNFKTEPEENVDGRSIAVPRGKGLGGSTLINGMIFVRGQPEDYDLWAQQGALGWSFEQVRPFFKKLESYHGDSKEDRGRGGPMHVSHVTEHNPLADAYIDAAVEAGYERTADYNGQRQDGFGYYQATFVNGRRWSARDAYLTPAQRRSNLSVRSDSYVTRILLDGTRAQGVEYRRNGQLARVHARREVILAAGAIQSPQLLEVSGIGDPARLLSLGIAVQHALKGVGENYRDHFATRMNWRITQPVTLNELSRGTHLVRAVARYLLSGTGILTLGTGLAHGFVKTRPELETPDVQYFFMHASYANAADRVLDTQPGATIGVAQLRPQSVGSIHAVSSDPMTPPAIRPNFLSASVDRDALVDGMKIARTIMSQNALKPFVKHELSPGPSVEADQDWLKFARANGQTIYHPIGTCRMGSDPMAVVDPQLRVHGISGLRVVDASVMPSMVSGNTQAAVMMIAEKASDMIQAEASRA